MGKQGSGPEGLPAAYQENNQTGRQKDRADRQPEGQGVGLAARRVGRTDPTHPTNQEHPGRPEADEAARDRRPARALGKEPPPNDQTWEQREGVSQVGTPKQTAKNETCHEQPLRLHLSDPRRVNVGPSMLAGAGWVNTSRYRHYGEMVTRRPSSAAALRAVVDNHW